MADWWGMASQSLDLSVILPPPPPPAREIGASSVLAGEIVQEKEGMERLGL